jgi:adenine-specific DNA-methyltransferase
LSEVRLFDQATGQHNLMVVLEKCSDAQRRAKHRPKWITLKGGLVAPGVLSHGFLDQDEAQNTWATVQTLSSSQAALGQTTHRAGSGWRPTAGTKVESVLEALYTQGTPLEKLLQDQQGVISGADRVTPQNWASLPPGWADKQGIRVGEGIFCLTPPELEALNLEPEALAWAKPFFKNAHLTRYGIYQTLEEAERLLYIHQDCPVETYPNLYKHLSRFRPLLERKRECQAGKIPWYRLHWPRSQRLLEAPALVTARRAPANRFAIAEAGWYENSDLTLLVPREGHEAWLYFYLGLLNSSALNFWTAHRGKPKGKLFEYYATPIRKIPLCRPDQNPALTETLISLTMQACQQQDDWLRQRKKAPKPPLLKQAPGIGELQKAIDQQVYQLYGLTKEHIAPIEDWQQGLLDTLSS